MEIILSKTAVKQFDNVLKYLEKNWSHAVAEEFYNKYLDTLNTISVFPFSCPESKVKIGLRLARITKHNRLYYKYSHNKILVYFIWDTRKKSYKR